MPVLINDKALGRWRGTAFIIRCHLSSSWALNRLTTTMEQLASALRAGNRDDYEIAVRALEGQAPF